MSGGWTHAETKALNGLLFQAVRQRMITTWQKIATPLIRIESLLPNCSFEHAQCALNSHCHECEFNANSMLIDARYHVNRPLTFLGWFEVSKVMECLGWTQVLKRSGVHKIRYVE